MLFSHERKLSLTIPAKDEDGARSNIAFLVRHLCDTVMKDPRKELFVLDDTVYVCLRFRLNFPCIIWGRPSLLSHLVMRYRGEGLD